VKICGGATRLVLVFKSFVVKVPTFLSWRLFLHGLLANMQEELFSGVNDCLCPVIWADIFGFVLIMKRAYVIPNRINHLNFCNYLEAKYKNNNMREFILSDSKPSNWGILKGNLVKIDYGS